MVGNLCDMEKREITNYFVNGKCSKCGGCCGRYLPISNKEINQIKAYIAKHNIMRNFHAVNVLKDSALDMTCPFLDDNNKCTIYEVRPLICREFTCERFINGERPTLKLLKAGCHGADMIETFFP